MRLESLNRVLAPPRLRVFTRGDWHIYFDPHNFHWVRVNDSGRYLMELIRKYYTRQEMTARVMVDHELPEEQARQAVDSFVDHLVQGEFLHLDEYRERPRTRQEDRTFPAHIYLHMTNACNLKCPYCYNKDDREFKMQLQKSGEYAATLGTEEYKHLITRLVEEGIQRLFFTGGEPLMRPDVMELAAHAREVAASLGRKIELEILTNAILIKGETVERLCDLFDAVTISLDGHERHLHEYYRGRNSFRPTVRGVRNLIERRQERGSAAPYVAIVPALTDRNIGFMKEIFEFALDDLGADGLAPILFQAGDHQELSLKQIPPLDVYRRELGRTGEYLKGRSSGACEGASAIEDRATEEDSADRPSPRPVSPRQHCGVGHGEISVDPSGVVYPCQSLHFDEFACGSVREQDIKEIFLESPVMKRVRGLKVRDLAVCSHCDFRELCNGGCRATAYNVYRRFDAHNEIYCQQLESLAVDKMWGADEVPAGEVAHDY
jgi:radical SAM protein with 4Fe4S-binding SPASM domain